MPITLILLLVAVPVLELLVVIEVGQAIGAGPTILLLLATSVLGLWLLKLEGRSMWQRFRRATAEGRWPGDEVAQAALIMLGGALLLLPGFVTDAIGLVLLLRPARLLVMGRLRRRVRTAPGPGGVADARTARPTAAWDLPPGNGPGDPGDPRSGPRDPRRDHRKGSRGGRARPTPPPLDVEVVEVQRDDDPPQ